MFRPFLIQRFINKLKCLVSDFEESVQDLKSLLDFLGSATAPRICSAGERVQAAKKKPRYQLSGIKKRALGKQSAKLQTRP